MTEVADRTAFEDKAKEFLIARGFVVLREKSYRQAQERQRCAEVRAKCEQEYRESTTEWAHKAFDSQREAWDRTTYLYGLAASLGATPDQLRGDTYAHADHEDVR